MLLRLMDQKVSGGQIRKATLLLRNVVAIWVEAQRCHEDSNQKTRLLIVHLNASRNHLDDDDDDDKFKLQQGIPLLIIYLIIVVVLSTLLPYGDSKFIRLKKKKIKLATQAASALVLLRKPKKVVFPLPLPVPLPIPIITKHDPVIHPIDPL